MQEVSKNQIKYIRSLSQIKFRKEHQAYIVEGIKNAEEWIQQQAAIEMIVANEDWYQENKSKLFEINPNICFKADTIIFEKISGFKTPNQVLMVVKMPQQLSLNNIDFSDWTLVLDKVQDPGNLGTIIRTADWFGIKNIVCSHECVEQYNPKVIQATMGSLLRVNCIYTNLVEFLEKQSSSPIYAAVLGGKNLDLTKQYEKGFIVMGNESKGISPEVLALANHKLTIAKIGQAESLNVSVATGILCHALIQ